MSLLDPYRSNFAAVPYQMPQIQNRQQFQPQYQPYGAYTPSLNYNQRIQGLLGYDGEDVLGIRNEGGDFSPAQQMSYAEIAQAFENSPTAQAIAANPGMFASLVGLGLTAINPALAPVASILSNIAKGVSIAKSIDPSYAEATRGTSPLSGYSPPGSIQAAIDQGLLSIPQMNNTPYEQTLDFAYAMGVQDAAIDAGMNFGFGYGHPGEASGTGIGGMTGTEGFGAAADSVGGAGPGADAGAGPGADAAGPW